MSQVELSKKLGLSAAALSEIMRGKNSPSAEVVLHIEELLKEENSMIRTPTLRPGIADDNDDDLGNMSEPPATLHQAKCRLELQQREASFLQQKLATRHAGKPAASTSPIMPAAKESAPTGTYTTPPNGKENPAFTDGQNWTGKHQVRDFPPGADNPRDITQHITGLSTPALREHLRSQPKTEAEKLQQKLVFAELKSRK
jgi:transcriptional regulator with XRE-family HTH domain